MRYRCRIKRGVSTTIGPRESCSKILRRRLAPFARDVAELSDRECFGNVWDLSVMISREPSCMTTLS